MRARALALSLLSSVAVLAVGWQLGTQGQTSSSTEAAPTTAAASPTGSTAVPSTTATATPSATETNGGSTTNSGTGSDATTGTTSSGTSGTFTGTSVQTRFGDVQVQVTVENGSITDVVALQLTEKEQKSVSISNRAAPVLRQEVLTAQSANVQSVSGATYTSDAYLNSVQSALDQAGL